MRSHDKGLHMITRHGMLQSSPLCLLFALTTVIYVGQTDVFDFRVPSINLVWLSHRNTKA